MSRGLRGGLGSGGRIGGRRSEYLGVGRGGGCWFGFGGGIFGLGMGEGERGLWVDARMGSRYGRRYGLVVYGWGVGRQKDGGCGIRGERMWVSAILQPLPLPCYI